MMWPATGVVPVAPERIEPLEVGHLSAGKTAGGHDAVGGEDPVAGVGSDLPLAGLFNIVCGQHPGLKLDVRPELETVCHMVGVAQQFRLTGVALAPRPLLLQIVRERVGILQGLGVAARSRVAVPVPGAADPAAGLEHPCRQPHAPQPVQHVHPGETRPDDDGVIGRCRRPCRTAHRHISLLLARPSWSVQYSGSSGRCRPNSVISTGAHSTSLRAGYAESRNLLPRSLRCSTTTHRLAGQRLLVSW